MRINVSFLSALAFTLNIGCTTEVSIIGVGTGGEDTGDIIQPEELDVDQDGWTVEDGDCDDANPFVYPNAIEFCDEVDNDCNGLVDEPTEVQTEDSIPIRYIMFPDNDGDMYGVREGALYFCSVIGLEGWATGDDDCDDTNPNVHPEAEEVCDWVTDNNCDGILDTGEIDGSYDANGDGDFDDPGDVFESGGPDGYTWCYPYHVQNDVDGDGYCSTGQDLNGDGDCTDAGDILYPSDQYCPVEYRDCDVTDPNIYPGHGC